MAEKQINESEEILDAIVTTPYKYGFTTDIEIEEFEKGLNLEIVKKISKKKNQGRSAKITTKKQQKETMRDQQKEP